MLLPCKEQQLFQTKLRSILLEYPEVEFVLNATGYSMLTGSMIPNNGFMFVTLVKWDERDRTVKEMVDEINHRLALEIKGAQGFAFGPPAIPGLGNGSGFSHYAAGQGRKYT